MVKRHYYLYRPSGPKQTQTKSETTSSYFDRTSLVNKGFIIWLYLQVKTPRQKRIKLFCSHRSSLRQTGVRFIFREFLDYQSNHRKLGILNYLKDLVLQWLEGSKQLLSRQNLFFCKFWKIIIESGKLTIFSQSRSGGNNKDFYKLSVPNQ